MAVPCEPGVVPSPYHPAKAGISAGGGRSAPVSSRVSSVMGAFTPMAGARSRTGWEGGSADTEGRRAEAGLLGPGRRGGGEDGGVESCGGCAVRRGGGIRSKPVRRGPGGNGGEGGKRG